MVSPRRALFSVSDKEGLFEFARRLHALGFELIGTEGTAKTLKDAGLPMLTVADYTGLREGLGGRVKTLHPKIFAGILAPRGDEKDLADLGAVPIDLVVVNLYPFETTVAKPDVRLEDAIENVDVGRVRPRHGASLRGESVSEGGLVPRAVPVRRDGDRGEAPGKGVVVQQPDRPRCGLAPRDGVRATRGGRDQAHESVRGGARGDACRGVHERPCGRPDLGLRRSRRTEPSGRSRDRESDEEGCPRRGHRAGVRAGRTRPPEIEEERNLPGPPDPRTVPERPRDRHGPCPR